MNKKTIKAWGITKKGKLVWWGKGEDPAITTDLSVAQQFVGEYSKYKIVPIEIKIL